MKITKTTLLFIATLFFLALPLAFVGSNAQAALPYTYNWTGAEHNADGGWTMPTDNGTCIGADASTPVDGNAQTLGKQGPRENCGSVQPAWVGTDFPTQTGCTAAGYAWKGSCAGPSGHFHYAAECTDAGGVWTPNPDGPGNCENMWYSDTSTAYQTGAETNHECLYCHNGGHGYNMSGYLKSAHANATRKADGHTWITPIEEGSVPYTSDGSGNAIDWANKTIDISGTPTPFYWIFGSWLEGAPDSARIIYQGFSQYGSSWVDCNRCHATGYDADSTPNASLEPYASFPSLAVGATPADAPLNMTGNADESTTGWADWQHWGITCSRCHNAVDGGHADSGPAVNDLPATSSAHVAGSVTPDQAVQQTFVCYQCHYQNDSKNLRDPQVTYPGKQLVDGGSAVVERHANGFLNSPHARFSGTYGQLADSTQYDTHFLSHGSCAACHNVHDSVTDNAADAKTWNAECGLDCHGQSGNYSKPLSAIQHPTGPGTPLYGVTVSDPVEACQTCHMPGGLHLFRINPDPSYSTSTGGTYLNAIPDPTHNNFPSVYVDLDLACGQCHGGDTANAQATAQAHGAPYMTKAELAPYAEVMHGGTGSSAPTGKLFMWTNDTSNPYVVNFTVTGAACTEGGCSYSWDFGDGNTASGPAVSNDYSGTTAGTPVNVTLTVSNGGTNTQIVTPLDIHTAPTCAGNAAFSTAVNAGVSGMAVSFTDGTTTTSDGSPGVYVNWGDGSPLSTGGTGATFNHTYIWANSHVGYKVTEIVQDNEGFTCVNNAYVKIGNGGAAATTGDVTINVTSGVKTSYYFKQGGLTKASGSFTDAQVAAGSAAVTVPTGTYDLYLYFATGHTCDYTQGQSATTGDTVNVTCTTP